eukprot:8533413-Pyramimonas_sp.AAC.1
MRCAPAPIPDVHAHGLPRNAGAPLFRGDVGRIARRSPRAPCVGWPPATRVVERAGDRSRILVQWPCLRRGV